MIKTLSAYKTSMSGLRREALKFGEMHPAMVFLYEAGVTS